MLSTTSLTMAYGTRTLWQDLDLTVEGGTMAALVGPSGSGKSTLLNCVGLLARPTSGRIEFDGRDVTALGSAAARRFRRHDLGYLFQNYALVEDSTVRENLAVAHTARRRRGAAARRLTDQALSWVGIGDRLDEKVARLSGGEQQRVALARLLLKQPRLVLADEPTGALDRTNTEAVIGLLRGLADDGACVIIATHDDWVQDACDQRIDVAGRLPAVAAQTDGAAWVGAGEPAVASPAW
ncbi:MAG TPA: ABC transporter ATP-binding protein [Propionibacteriaceae bacterium]